MPHISSRTLDAETYQKIFDQLAEIVADTKKRSAYDVLSSVLTSTEQVMLSKRVAAILMFAEGYSQYVVEKTLHLSSSTVARLYRTYCAGAYDSIEVLFKHKKKSREQFWKTLEILLRGGMPSMGRDRWKHLD